jgi:methylenetetrahydrofolate dehydrogenase (NAD+)
MSSNGSIKLSVDEIAGTFRTQIKQYIADTMYGRGPKLVGFLANDDSSAKKYAEWTRRACESDGIRYELREISRDDLEEALKEANEDHTVHGIIIYYPYVLSLPAEVTPY